MRILYIDGKTMSIKNMQNAQLKKKKYNELDKMLPNVAKILNIQGDFLGQKKEMQRKQMKCCISLNKTCV